ncbi:hypothetical protein VIGAN_08060600 [Vigna angularis var. angularis]|uniref:Uncharacterized protein n=1 Tax=Vigna angularis var. angularis TaxID=157739 RepID=A0A0S3SMM9_PHAAN|nr:hypothetical protein VIGAN_08060600 [Vigna angularis var. angularis]
MELRPSTILVILHHQTCVIPSHTISSITLLPSYYVFQSFHTLGSPKARTKEKTGPKRFAQRTLCARRDKRISHSAPPNSHSELTRNMHQTSNLSHSALKSLCESPDRDQPP